MASARGIGILELGVETELRSDLGMFRYVRVWVLLLVLFVYVEANGLFSDPYTAYLISTVVEHDATGAAINAGLWMITAILILPKLRKTVTAVVQIRPLLYFAILAPMSALWSSVPDVTFRRGVLLDIAILFGSYLGSQFTTLQQRKLLLASGVIVAMTSILMVILFPYYGLMPLGEWKGIFFHKNELAQAMELLFSPLLFMKFSTLHKKVGAIALGLLALITMYGSAARTGAVLSAVIVGVAFFGRIFRRADRRTHPLLFFVAIVTICLFLYLAIDFSDEILRALGKDSKLTGRAETWPILIPFLFRHPVIGYGYYGFWNGLVGDSGVALSGMHGAMSTADNGYIDMGLQFGFFGLAMLATLLYSSFRDFVRSLRKPEPTAAFWYLAFLLDAVLGNLSGTFFLAATGVSTIVLVMTCVSLRRMSIYGDEPGA